MAKKKKSDYKGDQEIKHDLRAYFFYFLILFEFQVENNMYMREINDYLNRSILFFKYD